LPSAYEKQAKRWTACGSQARQKDVEALNARRIWKSFPAWLRKEVEPDDALRILWHGICDNRTHRAVVCGVSQLPCDASDSEIEHYLEWENDGSRFGGKTDPADFCKWIRVKGLSGVRCEEM
jgi:hypothetical protein